MEKQNTHAICEVCHQPMAPKRGCSASTFEINGKCYQRIKAGDEFDLIPDMGEDEVCHDCNAGAGQYHHLGCDAERCPICYHQLISCDCGFDELWIQ